MAKGYVLLSDDEKHGAGRFGVFDTNIIKYHISGRILFIIHI